MIFNKFAAAANMLVLFFLFCEGKTEENLEHIFNLFDADGNKVGLASQGNIIDSHLSAHYVGHHHRGVAQHDGCLH